MSARLPWCALVAYVLCRGLFLVGAIPPWQGPDEPGHAEYAWRVAAGHAWSPPPDAALEAAILRSMSDARFFARVRAAAPVPPPARFVDVPRLRDAPTQRVDETPVGYLPFAAAAMLHREGADIAARLRATRMAAPWLVLGTLAFTAALAAWTLGRRLALPVAVTAAGLPWMGFAGAVVNPDLVAALLAAAWFAALARIVRRRAGTPGAAATLLALAVAGALGKRTAAYLLPLTLGWAVPRLWRALRAGEPRAPWRRAAAVVGAITVAAGALAAWPLGDRPAGWARAGEPWGPVRVAEAARSGGWGLRIVDADPAAWQYLEQWVALPAGGADVHATAWLRAAAGATSATAQLVVNDDQDAWSGRSVALTRAWTRVDARVRIPEGSGRVRVAVVPGDGTASGVGAIDADDVSLVTVPGPGPGSAALAGPPAQGDRLVGGDAETPRRLGPVLAAAAARYTAAARLWGALAGGWRDPGAAAARAVDGAAFAWRSYWGGYGWLAIWPGAGFLALAGLVTVAATLAVATALVRPERVAARPDVARACAAGVVLGIAAALFGSLAGAGPDRLPQGRYFLAVAAPLSVVMVGLADRAWPRHGAALLAGGVLCLDVWAVVAVVWPAFRGP